ncbi:MAG: SusD/RagB family nutrient-binding outer rane lipoprotein [Mucilaginibacter sp.]|nr:SusD/RagB family nutrient-binding outer rane lipoprotein [Mucilaginibacter sp.]
MKKYILIICLTLGLAESGCKRDYLDLNTNPNTPSAASPDLLLSGALKTTAGFVNSGSYVMYAAWVGYLSQSTGYQPFVALEQYQFTTSSYDAWTTPYLNISNYTALQNAAPSANYAAIAKIMIAYDYEGLVDNYNNIPYTTAIQGTGNLNPTYTAGPAVYADLMKQLDAAITAIQGAAATAAKPTGADIMYGGNMTNWIKFANTLKLRLCMRVSTNPNQSALYGTFKAAVAATSALGYIDTTNPASVNPGYTNSDANGGQQSPLWLNYGTSASGTAFTNRAQYQANSFNANLLGSNQDPRLIRIYAPSPTPAAATTTTAQLLPGSAVNTYPDANGKLQAVVSTTFGDSQPPTAPSGGLTPSLVGPGILKSPTMPGMILSAEESLFLQAEAAKNGVIAGGVAAAQTFYNAGITASFVDLNAQVNTVGSSAPLSPAASATQFYTGAYAYPTAGTDAQQEQAIITQKYIALSLFGAFEAFNEERRTGYPNVPTSIYPGANAPNQVTRIFYPFVEYQTNAASVAAQPTVDKFNSKIFWAIGA